MTKSKLNRAVNNFAEGVGEGLIRGLEFADNVYDWSYEDKVLFIEAATKELKKGLESMLEVQEDAR